MCRCNAGEWPWVCNMCGRVEQPPKFCSIGEEHRYMTVDRGWISIPVTGSMEVCSQSCLELWNKR